MLLVPKLVTVLRPLVSDHAGRNSFWYLDVLWGLQPACSAASTTLPLYIWTNCGYVQHMCRGGSAKQEGQGLFTCNLQGLLNKVNLQRLCT